jgi:hypothetical protein
MKKKYEPLKRYSLYCKVAKRTETVNLADFPVFVYFLYESDK